MAAVDCPLDDRAVAAPLGPAAIGDRRWRGTGLFEVVLGLPDDWPAQRLLCLAYRAARPRTGNRIRRGADLGDRHNSLQRRHVLGDPPPDRAGDPGRDWWRARPRPP